jgi:hypothetical protein
MGSATLPDVAAVVLYQSQRLALLVDVKVVSCGPRLIVATPFAAPILFQVVGVVDPVGPVGPVGPADPPPTVVHAFAMHVFNNCAVVSQMIGCGMYGCVADVQLGNGSALDRMLPTVPFCAWANFGRGIHNAAATITARLIRRNDIVVDSIECQPHVLALVG